ncbi:HNH endonuclease-domain-containing protein [Tuber brumale]|nr:HNH endonuclease-domain-containing protein [Tuber brumale]
MPTNRSSQRNFFFCDATNPDEALGGLVQNGSITEANSLDILGILLVIAGASIEVIDEPWVYRIISHNVTGRDRDRKCVISGIVNFESSIQADNWAGFEAAHIFPLQRESYWIEHNYGLWITDTDDAPGSSKINSSQNGILLRADIHQMFDQYLISVNPDNGYKVVVFDLDRFGLDGRILDPVCRSRDDPHHAADELLRWHFRQSVFANMRGAGEPIFQDDFRPGSDPAGEILAGLYAQETTQFVIPARWRQVS